MCTWALCCWLQASGAASQPADPVLPPGSPPIPDFVHPVDYLEWYIQAHRCPEQEDASPLWRELTTRPGSSLSEREERWLWGCTSPDHWVPGLLTGCKQYTPQDYPWDPKDHWDWEEAYQLQQALSLEDKIRAAAGRSCMSVEILSFLESSEENDYGFAASDRLLCTALFPSLLHGGAASVVLQNAWRAPGGRPDPEKLLDAVQTGLQLAEQLRTATFNLNWWRCQRVRDEVYDTVLGALHHRAFDASRWPHLRHLLESLDCEPIEVSWFADGHLAMAFELLQFAYAQQGQRWSLPPRINTENFRKVALLTHFMEADAFTGVDADVEALLDWASRLDQHDPRVAVEQLLDLYTRIAACARDYPPVQADARINSLYREFRNNRSIHPLIASLSLSPHFEPLTELAETEAKRRAVCLLIGLHEVHARTGAWPARLRQVKLRVGPDNLIDPFSRNEFVYRVENGQPLLYSVARNGVDDGGKHDRRWGDPPSVDQMEPNATDYVFWPLQQEANGG